MDDEYIVLDIQAFAYPRTFRGSSIHKYLALYVEPYINITIITDKKDR